MRSIVKTILFVTLVIIALEALVIIPAAVIHSKATYVMDMKDADYAYLEKKLGEPIVKGEKKR